MKDERDLTPVVISWLRETLPSSSESERLLESVSRTVPTVRQQRRPWPPWPVGRSRIGAPDTEADAELRAHPVPVTNGRNPTVIGRTVTMFSPAKAITAGALVFVFGAAFLIAQPFAQQGSAPGAVTQEAEAVEFSVMFPWPPGGTEGTSEVRPDGITETVGVAARATASESSDPRFEGDLSASCNSHSYPSGHVELHACIIRIESGDGAWQNEPAVWVGHPNDSGYGQLGPFAAVFEGEGAYDGQTAIVEAEVADEGIRLYGIIVDAGLPPDPDSPE